MEMENRTVCHLQHQHFRPSHVPHYSETKGQFSDFKFLVILSKEQKVTLAQFNVPLLVKEFKWHSELDHLNSCFKKAKAPPFSAPLFYIGILLHVYVK